MTTYNGHKNWNHWNVSLWLWNTESRYRWMLDLMQLHKNKDDVARAMMAQLRQEQGRTPRTPDGAKYSFSSIRAALQDIDA